MSKEKIKKHAIDDNGWKSRKLWMCLGSLLVAVIAGFTGYLTMNLTIALIVIPATYGMANVTLKKVGVAEFSEKE